MWEKVAAAHWGEGLRQRCPGAKEATSDGSSLTVTEPGAATGAPGMLDGTGAGGGPGLGHG